MQPLTSAIALICGMLILTTGPVVGLSAYCIGLFCYPQYVTLNLGPLHFTVSRILILIVLAQLLFRFRLRRGFRWNRIDTAFLLFWLLSSLALLANESARVILINRGGTFFDTVLPYLAVRLAIRTREDVLKFTKGLVLIGLYLAALGVYQSVTWYNPMGFLRDYADPDFMGGGSGTNENLVRHGFYRADVASGNYIAFGMFFAALCPLCLTLKRNQGGWPDSIIIVCFIVLFGGLLSSWSSGPLFSVVVALGAVAFFPWRRFWRPALVLFVIGCLFVEFYSNRHFYDVLTRFAFSGETAAYRIALYEEALGGGMRGRWICGWGLAGLYPRGPDDPFNWENRDMTSQYIGALMQFGLMGLVPLLVLTHHYYRRMYQAARIACTRDDRWMVWCFSAGLIGWSVGTLTVGFVGQMAQLASLLIGIACNMPSIVRHHDSGNSQSPPQLTPHRRNPAQRRVSNG